MLCSFSNLSEKDLEEVKALEQETGVTVLAFSCKDLPAAALDQDKLDKIQAIEKKLGMSLVAVDA